jgi:ATP-binding cassette subfamily F protein 3
MIRVTDVEKSFGNQVLFEGLSFTINAREKIGLVGRNGTGKTTLFQIILGTIEPDEGSVAIPDGYRIGYLEQHIHFSQHTVLNEACTSLPREDTDNSWKAEKMLFGLGFSPEDLQKQPGVLSGGFQIRLNLAKLLLSEPDLLLLDEPNNYLDIVAVRWLSGFLRAWKGELMLITHDRNFMDSVTTHIMALHRQRARKIAGDTGKMYDQIAQDEEIYEKTRINDEKKRKATELFISRFRAKARLAGMVQSRIKCLEKQDRKKELSKIESLEFSFNAAAFPAAQMMSCHNVSFSYDHAEPWLIGKVSLTIGKRERLCVIGKNGRGKSTLIKLLSGELFSNEGTIKKHPALQTACFSQTNIKTLNDNKTVYEEIMSADPKCLPQHARDIAGGMMFEGDAALKKIAVLSGGEKSRVLLGKLLAAPAHLLLLDEPTNHLDMDSCDTLMEAIDEFEGSMVMVTHNELFLHRLATKLIIFDRGRITLFNGCYADFLETIGWSDEGLEAKRSSSAGAPDAAKELKRRKAELINERSRAVKPVEAEMKALEAAIKSREDEMHRNMELLVEASSNGEGEKIAALAKRNHVLKPETAQLYDKLLSITDQYEKIIMHYKELLG